jgi:2-polyprenyl-3-methyl-5-hydroxy-6-metoxy-1,4-benzoquinol methylase
MINHAGPIIAERDGLTAINCRACGFIHLDWLPTGAELSAYYKDDFWQKEKAGWRERHEAEAGWLAMRHDDWLAVLAENTLGRTLLDVGCGWGHFLLRALHHHGWRAWGIEPNAEAAQYCLARGVRLLDDDWQHLAGQEAEYKFDAITALWLIEHLPNPAVFLRWCRARLYTGGTLVIAIPNEWSVLQDKANEEAAVKNWWLHKTHLSYWSAASIYGLLGRCGFRVVDALGTWPMEFNILLGADYTNDPDQGAKLHAGVREHELGLTQAARLKLGRDRGLHGEGRDLVLFCKPE